MKPNDLRIPGPTPIPPQIMRAMQRPMIPHRGDDFHELHLGLLDKLKHVHKTDGDVFVLPGSGSVGWEAAIVNTLSPGDKVVAFITGEFGKRFAAVAERFQLDVVRVEVDPGKAATLDVVEPALAEHPDAKAVLYTYNETSTGVMNPLVVVAPAVRQHGALLFVDAVSAAGALTLETDAWGLDVVISGSQKAWMCPPGMAILALGDRVQQAEQRASFPRSFLDFSKWRTSVAKGDTPATGPLSLYYALDVACDLILAEGLEARYQRHEDAGCMARERLRAGGVELLADSSCASNTVTAARPPAGMDAKTLVGAVRDRFDIEIAAGQGDLANEIIRVGHMGWFSVADIERSVDAIVAVIADKVTA